MNVLVGIIARHALTVFGGYLAAKGIGESEVQTVIGALSALAGVVWSYFNKKNLGAFTLGERK